MTCPGPTVADLVEQIVGPDLPIGLRADDGSSVGPADPPAIVVIRPLDALRRILTALRARLLDALPIHGYSLTVNAGV